jgi:LasA protease
MNTIRFSEPHPLSPSLWNGEGETTIHSHSDDTGTKRTGRLCSPLFTKWRGGGGEVLLFLALFLTLACSASTAPTAIFITATVASPVPTRTVNLILTTATPLPTPIQPTPNPPLPAALRASRYTVQFGDTLGNIALAYGSRTEDILALNPTITEETILYPGQELLLPGQLAQTTSDFKIIPDSELVYSPYASRFDLYSYIRFQPGYIRFYGEFVSGRWMTGADIIEFVSKSASVNPRLLLAMLEYRSGWVTNPIPNPDTLVYPMGFEFEDLEGFFLQTAWAANQLNGGYYGYKHRGVYTLELPDETRATYAEGLNPGTIGLQFFLSRTADSVEQFTQDISPQGFYATYSTLFGDPFRNADEPIVPAGIEQPELTLPFRKGEVWRFTSGPHGGWDRANSGWSAIDFAPMRTQAELAAGSEFCSPAQAQVAAMARGLVVRSGDGAVVLDLDMDGNEHTGWVIVYLHIADNGRIPAGTVVRTGDPIGNPSCEGFNLNSNGTHVHISRLYNGEWIPADCWACIEPMPPFVMSGWRVQGYDNQVYQGWLEKDGEVIYAESAADATENKISW